jgi:hypothetical protein
MIAPSRRRQFSVAVSDFCFDSAGLGMAKSIRRSASRPRRICHQRRKGAFDAHDACHCAFQPGRSTCPLRAVYV